MTLIYTLLKDSIAKTDPHNISVHRESVYMLWLLNILSVNLLFCRSLGGGMGRAFSLALILLICAGLLLAMRVSGQASYSRSKLETFIWTGFPEDSANAPIVSGLIRHFRDSSHNIDFIITIFHKTLDGRVVQPVDPVIRLVKYVKPGMVL